MPRNAKTSKVEKRNRIIDAAVLVFSENGYHQARVSEIAKKAGVADGTIYLYFRNKEDLLLCVFEKKMGDLIQELRTSLEDVLDPFEKIRIFANQHFEQIQKHPHIAQVLQVELRQSQRFIREYRPEKLWEYLSILGAAIREGQQQGAIRKDVDPFVLQWSFFGAIDELSVQWILSRKRERFNLKQMAKQLSDVFINGLINK